MLNDSWIEHAEQTFLNSILIWYRTWFVPDKTTDTPKSRFLKIGSVNSVHHVILAIFDFFTYLTFCERNLFGSAVFATSMESCFFPTRSHSIGMTSEKQNQSEEHAQCIQHYLRLSIAYVFSICKLSWYCNQHMLILPCKSMRNELRQRYFDWLFEDEQFIQFQIVFVLFALDWIIKVNYAHILYRRNKMVLVKCETDFTTHFVCYAFPWYFPQTISTLNGVSKWNICTVLHKVQSLWSSVWILASWQMMQKEGKNEWKRDNQGSLIWLNCFSHLLFGVYFPYLIWFTAWWMYGQFFQEATITKKCNHFELNTHISAIFGK